uniref:Uncharacterized protein LOC102804320 n=1 Tax=Saccoglossus kowalevskii TaxID=10224 RepID=A0ABM0MYQ6_SACKO|nr:PREDICTED: uncharacterized protein LOC102804320 [Saccoglossus kowalevskii]
MEEEERRRKASSRFQVVKVDEPVPVKKLSLVDLIAQANDCSESQALNENQENSRNNIQTPSFYISDESLASSSRNFGENETSILIPNEEVEVVTKKKSVYESGLCSGGGIFVFIFFIIMVIGVVLIEVLRIHREMPLPVMNFLYVLRAVGIFGFAGGLTNWIAVKMIFFRIPGIPGSGIISRHFIEIRHCLSGIVLESFFDKEFLSEYLKDKYEDFAEAINLDECLNEVMKTEKMNDILNKCIDEILTKPEGIHAQSSTSSEKDSVHKKIILKQILEKVCLDNLPLLVKDIKSLVVSGENIRQQLEILLKTKENRMTANQVNKITKNLIGHHLSWLIIWGSIFGALIGLITELCTTVV